MKNIVKTLILVTAVATTSLTSCKKKNQCDNVTCEVGQVCDDGTCIVDLNQDQHDDAYGDVLIKKMNMMGNIKYKLVVFAGGASIIEPGSKVITPNGTEHLLSDFWAGSGSLRNMDIPIQSTKPEVGTYKFILKFSDGFTKEVTNELTSTEIDVPTVNITHAGNEVTLSWTPVAGADFYCIKLTELDMVNTKPFFKRAMLPASDTSYTFNTTTSAMPGWMRQPSELSSGTSYWVALAAKKVEAGQAPNGGSKNFQVSATTKQQIQW